MTAIQGNDAMRMHRVRWPWPVRSVFRWLDRQTIDNQLKYADAQFSVALAAGDASRAERLARIIGDLRASREEPN